MVYWTMGAAIEETTIVNRCKKEQTYEYRLKHGTLPESKHMSVNKALHRTAIPTCSIAAGELGC